LGNVEGRLESVEGRLGTLEGRFVILENRQAAMHTDSEKWFRRLERRLDDTTIKIGKLRGEMRGVEERLSSLEPKPS
jgi:chaperonin cofactor prefoldin